jgi:hypothetical protein
MTPGLVIDRPAIECGRQGGELAKAEATGEIAAFPFQSESLRL